MSTFGHLPCGERKIPAMSREERHAQTPGLSETSRTGNSKGYYKKNGDVIALPFKSKSKSYAGEAGASNGKLTRCKPPEVLCRTPAYRSSTDQRGVLTDSARLPFRCTHCGGDRRPAPTAHAASAPRAHCTNFATACSVALSCT